MSKLDALDFKVLAGLVRGPGCRIGELSGTLARHTARSRARRLLRNGILRTGGRDGAIRALRTPQEVLEVHEISGRGDIWCRVAATDTPDLQSALRAILKIKGVIRSGTSLARHEHIPYRSEPLLNKLAEGFKQ